MFKKIAVCWVVLGTAVGVLMPGAWGEEEPEWRDELTNLMDILRRDVEIQTRELREQLEIQRKDIEAMVHAAMDEALAYLEAEQEETVESRPTPVPVPPGTPAVALEEEVLKEREEVTQIIPLSYMDAGDFLKLVEGVYPVDFIRADQDLKIVIVRGSKSAVETLEEAVARFDVQPEPEPNLMLEVYFVEAIERNVHGEDVVNPPMDEALSAAMEELQKIVPAHDLKLAGSIARRGRNDTEISGTGVIPIGSAMAMSETSVEVGNLELEKGQEILHIDNFQAMVETPQEVEEDADQGDQPQPVRATRVVRRSPSLNFSGDFDLAPGQIAIVGRSDFGKDSRKLFILVRADVV